MTPQGKPYRVSVAPSGPGQWALIVRSLRVPAAVVRLDGFGSPSHARRLVDLAVADLVIAEGKAGRLVLAPVKPRHTLADLLVGMKPGDMPAAEGWDHAPPVGAEAW